MLNIYEQDKYLFSNFLFLCKKTSVCDLEPPSGKKANCDKKKYNNNVYLSVLPF